MPQPSIPDRLEHRPQQQVFFDGLSNHFSSIRYRKLCGGDLTPSEEEGVDAYEQLIRWLYPFPEKSEEEKRAWEKAREILGE